MYSSAVCTAKLPEMQQTVHVITMTPDVPVLFNVSFFHCLPKIHFSALF